MDNSNPLPQAEDLWFLPLGGTGEIGMNLNLYGHKGHWLMVDCGVTFQTQSPDTPRILMADPAFISSRRQSLVALVLTHAHEDHIGAVVHLWPRLQCPVYATAFTACVLRRKLGEAGLLDKVTVIEIAANHKIPLEPFEVEWIQITHSIPEAHGLIIKTDAGIVFHTGDWKLDPDPVLGIPIQKQQKRFEALSKQRISAMVCDSTNAMEKGRSNSEGELFSGLQASVASAEGAVVVTTFSSNLARLHTLGKVALATRRKMSLLGRSLVNMVAAARATGHWDLDLDLIPPKKLRALPRQNTLIVATGSQGDIEAALYRMAEQKHAHFRLQSGDLVIFSSRIIPGNELMVNHVIDRLKRLKVKVVTNKDAKVHASGHPAEEELRQMYSWVQPELVIPTHGTSRHMSANASIAERNGISSLTGMNGDLFQIAPEVKIEKGFAPVGRLGLWPGGIKAV